ncbi:hypothetical protein [Klebsiella pneumoniae]|uniref:hypothetical protein n=1 Tax=Klebsiella pneumoniae TaxID=573 RepID=UPI000CEB8D39|nr:hypothetical protein [Klebsiella pneumoniae]KAB1784066.1 hypothetical protein FXO04_03995 [Klebsiella pneumoniae]MBV7341655.1 hypothetical protein [Klebsiella pneumoniae]ROD64331.1 hypothetical protein C4Z09_014030 [Klebsiella pneumoniae subsp. pneumoniae]CAF9479015.1 hypothetical protein AI2903V1_4921 [Klebsiella pneumoniae]CAH5927745.1 hypothetical protein AI2903V1_4921 [Klebsiella pneumoniae]
MKREYADKINSLLQCFHFNKEFLEWNHDYSHQLLRHGVSHLYHFAMLQGENDEATLEELRNIIISITNGDIPKPYDLSSIDDNQPKSEGKTLMFIQPAAVSIEATPEMIYQLKQVMADIPAKLKNTSIYSR